jgi:ABC-2 type transport system permease protein
MSAFRDALAVEARKARSARVPFATGALLATGVSVLASTVVLAARSGNSELVAKLGPRAASGDWSALLSGAAQITSAAGLLACGVVISWIYGREFADGTVSALFGLPVSRGTLAVAKATVYAAWSVLVTLATTVLLLVAGLTIGLGPPDSDTFAGLGRQACLGVLTALIAAPAGWASTLGRACCPASPPPSGSSSPLRSWCSPTQQRGCRSPRPHCGPCPPRHPRPGRCCSCR